MATSKTDTATAEPMTMEELLATQAPMAVRQRGDVVEGTIVAIQHGELIVDVGAKAEGSVPANELRDERDSLGDVQPGDSILVYVVSAENENGQIQLSVKKASLARKWITLKKALEDGDILQAKVLEHNKGGVIVDVQRVRGFIPFSHLASGPSRTVQPQVANEELNALIGRELPVTVIEADQKTNRLIVSEKNAQQGAEKEKKNSAMAGMKIGDVLTGSVIKAMPFGILVEINGVEGLVHASEVTWDKGVDATTRYTPGQQVTVKVVELDATNGKINLSIKQLEHDPWESKAAAYGRGREVDGTVSKITSYGTIITIDGLEGLLRTSSANFKVGDSVSLYVENVDQSSRRLDLSLERPSDS